MSKPIHPSEALPSLATLPGLLQQISDRDLLLNEILAHAATQNSIEFYCWLQEDMVPRIQKLLKREEITDGNDG